MDDGRDYAAFQFAPAFVASGIQISPVTMPLSRQVYAFPNLARRTFHGLPGMLANSLPDRSTGSGRPSRRRTSGPRRRVRD